MDEHRVPGQASLGVRLFADNLHSFEHVHLSYDARPCILKMGKAVLEEPEDPELVLGVLGPETVPGPARQLNVRDVYPAVDPERSARVNVGILQDQILHRVQEARISISA